jgi:GT2 family glycosyltransferase
MAAASRPLISVIVPTYCRPASLRRCLASIAAQEYPRESFEVVVVDDGGTPAVTEDLREEFPGGPPLVLVREPHRGVAAARARGVVQARGGILAFLDDDCAVPTDYLASIERVFRRHPATRVVQVRILNPEPESLYGQAWEFLLEEAFRVNTRATADGRFTCATLGGVFVATRDIFDRVAWDARFSRTREDADLRYQLHGGGIPVYYEADIRVFHFNRPSLCAFLAQFVHYGRGQVHLRRKWRGVPPPYSYASATSRPALRRLLRARGWRRGLAVYAVLVLRRHAANWGVLYEQADLDARYRLSRWPRFIGLVTAAYARRLKFRAQRMLGRR